MQFYTHEGFTDCFIEIKKFTGTYIFARYWIQGTTMHYPCTDWEIIQCTQEKQQEFKLYTPKNNRCYLP